MKVVGGLGNQIFGYIFGLAVAKKLNSKLIVDDALIYFGSNKSRVLEINKLVASDYKLEFKQRKINVFFKKFDNRIMQRVFWKVASFNTFHENKINNREFRFKPNQKFYGYFQTWFYADTLASNGFDFKFSSKNLSHEYNEFLESSNFLNDIFIHVRLGDYLDLQDIYKIVPETYFLEAIAAIKTNRNVGRIILIAEDRNEVAICYPNLYEICDLIIDKLSGLSDLECFILLSSSNCIVASNSTYSMWAAWISKNRNGLAVVPEAHYFQPESQKLVDDRWDKVDKNTGKIALGSPRIDDLIDHQEEFNKKF